MRLTRPCRNPACPCPNPQPLVNFYPGKHFCKVCYKARIAAYKKAHRPTPEPVDESPSKGRYSGDRRKEWDEDIYLSLCEECPLDFCIRGEGQYRVGSIRKVFPGCLVWACEVARIDRAGVGEVIRLINSPRPPSQKPPAVPQTAAHSRP